MGAGGARGTYVAKMWTVILGELVVKNLGAIGSCGESRVFRRMLKAGLASLVDIGMVGRRGRRTTRALKSSTRKSIHGWSVPDWDDVTFAGLGFLSRMTRSFGTVSTALGVTVGTGSTRGAVPLVCRRMGTWILFWVL